MTFKFKPAALIAAVALMASIQSARADVTVTTKATMHSPMLDKARQSMTADQLAGIDAMTQSTMYMSGTRYRLETGVMTMIVDSVAKQMTIINDKNQKYAVMPLGPNMMKGMMGGTAGALMAGAGKPEYKVIDTGKNTKYLGHTCRHYIMDMKMTIPNMGTMTTHADVLAAMDLPGLDPSVYDALGAQMGVQGSQIKGIPLVTNMKMTSALTGAMTINQTATNISTETIPDSKFEVPEGYTETTQSAIFTTPAAAIPGT